jgi:hypothetical protein
LLASTEWVFVVASTASVVAAGSASMPDESETLWAPGDANPFPGVWVKLVLYPWAEGLKAVGMRLRYDSMLARRSPMRSIFFSLQVLSVAVRTMQVMLTILFLGYDDS